MNVNRSDLLKVLEIVKAGLSNKDIIEQATSFAFLGDRVATYNDEVSISHPLNIGVIGAVKATEFIQLLSKLRRDEIEINTTENEILLKCGKLKAGIIFQAKVTLPFDEIGSIDQKTWKRLPKTFAPQLKFAIQGCSKDMSTPILTCVNIREDGYLVSSDNYRALQVGIGKEMPVQDFSLPNASASLVVSLSPTHIILETSWAHFKNAEGTVISCRIFEEEFPKTEHLFKVKGAQITFPKTIQSVLDRASVFYKQDHFIDEMIDINIQDNKLTVKGSSEAGWSEESCNMKYEGTAINFVVTPYLLKEILKMTNSCRVSENCLKFEGENWKYIAVLRK